MAIEIINHKTPGTFGTIPLLTAQPSAVVPIPGNCVKYESSNSGKTLLLKSDQGESVQLIPGRTWTTDHGFNSFIISGYDPNEPVLISAGFGDVKDTSGSFPTPSSTVINAGPGVEQVIKPLQMNFLIMDLDAVQGGNSVNVTGFINGAALAHSLQARDSKGNVFPTGVLANIGLYWFNVTGVDRIVIQSTGTSTYLRVFSALGTNIS